MFFNPRVLFASAGILFCSNAVALADPDIVHIMLSDRDGPMAMDLGMGMAAADMSAATLKVDASPTSVKAGQVRFEVTNASKSQAHEMVVAKVDSGAALPYDKSQATVEEDSVTTLGEVAELEPGKSGSVQLMLEPGTYVLFCNIPGHYMGGMWTLLTVE
jgi:uncharacterized cupredoxin-like copper-binding protein